MTGLMMKEYYHVRKALLTFLIGILAFSAFGFLLLLSTKIGNLKDMDSDELTLLLYFFDILIPFASAFAGGIIVSDVLDLDKKCNWNKYMYSLPIKEWAAVGAKFLIALLASTISLIIVFGISVLYHVINEDFTFKTLGLPFMCFGAMFAISFIILAAGYVLQSKVKVAIFGGTLFMTGYVSFAVYISNTSSEVELFSKFADIKKFVTDNRYWLPVIICTVIMLSYLVSIKAMGRREKLC